MTEYFAGLDIGSTMTKAVILEQGVIASVIGPQVLNREGSQQGHGGSPLQSGPFLRRHDLYRVHRVRADHVPFADKQVTEISCHAKGVSSLFPQARTIVDIGGQDSKAITVDPHGRVTNFIMNDKCAAGSGRLLR